jgi:hypothetical protein
MNQEFSLTLEEYSLLVEQPCTYCGFDENEKYIGLDRIDNKAGYTLENVVPSCSLCNRARGSWFTHLEALLYLGPAIKILKDNRIIDKTNIHTSL